MIDVKHYQDALLVQDACNLSGVVHSFSQTLGELWAHAREQGEGTDWVNTHPISILYSAQIAWLSSGAITDVDLYYKAHNACTDTVRAEDVRNDPGVYDADVPRP